MSEEEKINQQVPQEKPLQERQPDVNIEKGQINEDFQREGPSPEAWQPVVDQTDSNPPDGGSGVGDSEEN